MASVLHLQLNSSPASKVVAALVALFGFPAKLDQESGHGNEFPVLIEGQNKLTGFDVARFIAEKQDPKLLGITDAEKKEVNKWIEWTLKELGDTSSGFDKKKHSGKLGKLHQALVDKVFLVTQHLTLADLALYAAVVPLMTGVDERFVVTSFALVRWFDYMQHYNTNVSVAISGSTLVQFDLNAPFKAQSQAKPAAAKGDAKDKAKGKQGQEGKEKEEEKPKEGAPSSEKEKEKEDHKKQQGKKGKQQPKNATAAPKSGIACLDIRVGVILSVTKHPEADLLYIEQIDLGEASPRQVISGLVKFIPEAELKGARVVCLCNLKPVKMKNVMSHAMVLCGSNADHTQVELVVPPEGAKPGEPVCFPGVPVLPRDNRLHDKKAFGAVQPDLFIGDDLVAYYKDKATSTNIPFTTSAGPCKVKSLAGSSIG